MQATLKKKRRVERGVFMLVEGAYTFLLSRLCRTLYRK